MSGGYEPVAGVENTEQMQGKAHDSEPEAKRQKLDDKDDTRTASNEVMNEFEAELKAANVQVIPTGEVDLLKDVVDDNVGSDVETGNGGWGVAADTSVWGDDVRGASASNERDDSGWATPTFSLLSILGPTTLPLTHASGVVEWSLRRIKAVILPSSSPPQPTTATGEGNPAAVEAELEKRFAKVVLEPWGMWDKTGEGEHFEPKILAKSKGAAIGFDGKAVGTGTGKVHDVKTDDIIILVLPSVASSLCIGMGLAATYVQIARQQTDGGEASLKEPDKKKKGGKKNKPVETLWYMEQLMMILPSYHTV
jgi:hypothetical protein